MTITLELPESIARVFEFVPEEERRRYAIEAILTGLKRGDPTIRDDEDLEPMSEEDIAAVQRGIEDLEAGRHRPFGEYLAEREAFWNLRGLSLFTDAPQLKALVEDWVKTPVARKSEDER